MGAGNLQRIISVERPVGLGRIPEEGIPTARPLGTGQYKVSDPEVSAGVGEVHTCWERQ